MTVYEITGNRTGIARDGVNFLEPADSYQNMYNGFIYRQILQSRFGFTQFSLRRVSDDIAIDNTRIMGIFENVLTGGVGGVDNITETLVISQKFLYKYDDTANVFDRIPMAGSVPGTGFAISNNYDYVSGTTYPSKTGANRFVFTGRGMADTYYYDGTNVKSFTLDNPDYAPPLAGNPPVAATLTNAWYIVWFGQRLNLFNPTINASSNPQLVVFSGIRNAAGNGDKFNVPGAGNLPADTFEYISGISILGNVIIANFSQSNWRLETTNDAFNPYNWRRIPSVVGTDAPFSFESWNAEVRSMGKTGIIKTDNRQSLRIDNKIPYFTADEIDPTEFELTYGGFDPIRGQFVFSYLDSGSAGDDTQNRVLVNNYEEDTWAINEERFSVFGNSKNGVNVAMGLIDETINRSWGRMDTTEENFSQLGVGNLTNKTLAGDDEGFVYELNKDYDDYFATISGITNATQAILTVSDSAFKAGDLVAISNVAGMVNNNGQSINNSDPSNPLQVISTYTVVDATNTTITINLNTTDFTTYDSGGTISKAIEFYAETIPFNPFREQGRMCRISHVEFLLDTNSGYLQVDVYQDEEEGPFKKDILIQPDFPTTKRREWITMSVDNEANFMTFVLKQTSVSNQVRQTSMRIHCEPGALTSG